MAGKSPVRADEDQRSALIAVSRSRDRSEADRARAILLTLSGRTRRQIAEAFGGREDTVRFWRSAFTAGGIEALKTAVAPGPAPVKAERALAVAEEGLSAPGANPPNRPPPTGGRCRVSWLGVPDGPGRKLSAPPSRTRRCWAFTAPWKGVVRGLGP